MAAMKQWVGSLSKLPTHYYYVLIFAMKMSLMSEHFL